MGKNDPKPQDETTAAPAVIPAPAPDVAPLTVAELAEKHGHSNPAPVQGDTPFTPLHLLADSLNGWTRHKAYKSEDVTLSDADYLAAIEAAKNGVAHSPANKRPLTVFTKEQAEAKMAADLAATIAARKKKPVGKKFNPGQAHQLVMQKARSLAQSSGVKLKGGR
jgi:hypothetical protein